MRPQAIANFEILFVISIVLGSAVSILTWDANVNEASFEATLVGEILGALVYTALALWAARKGSNIARWLTAGLIVLGFIAIALSVPEISEMGPIVAFTIPVYMVLQIAASIFLFSSDARPWFQRS